MSAGARQLTEILKGAITSKIKQAIKHKTSPARLAQQLCNSYASLAGLVLCFIACFILLVIRDVVLGTRTRTRSRGTCILRYLGAGHLVAAV